MYRHAALIATILLLSTSGTARAVTWTVNTIDDSDDGICNSAHCSLREAMDNAAIGGLPATIVFNIPGIGPHRIMPTAALPILFNEVHIQGPGYASAPRIIIDGSLAGSGASGINFGANSHNSTVDDLALVNWSSAGLYISGSDDVSVAGCFVGTENGITASGNSRGIFAISGARIALGRDGGRPNIISGNSLYGIVGAGANLPDLRIANNRVGTDVTGALPVPNGAGIQLQGPVGCQVEDNTIAFNTGYGIGVTYSTASGVLIRNNALFQNSGLGIDLLIDGPTANDPLDADSGPNGLQNHPVILSAVANAGQVTVTADLDSEPLTGYTTQFYLSPDCNSTGYGEGKIFLGELPSQTTDASGYLALASSFAYGGSTAGMVVTATATGQTTGSTSEFSRCLAVQNPAIAVSIVDLPDPIYKREWLSYEVTVSNLDLAPATGLEVLTLLDAEPTFLFADAGCVLSGDTVTCVIDSLGGLSDTSFSITVKPDVAGALSTTTWVTPHPAEANSSDNSATALTTVLEVFTNAQTLSGLSNPSIAWGDFDSDGDLDLAHCGGQLFSGPVLEILRNDGGTMVLAQTLAGIEWGDLEFADMDGDGDMDLLASGLGGAGEVTILYLNNGGVFVDSGTVLPGASRGEIAAADADGDGDLDLAIVGAIGSGARCEILRNDDGVFTATGSYPGLGDATADWCDSDGDGDLDLLVTGSLAGTPTTTLYRNDGGFSFVDSAAGFPGVMDGAADWSDIDNDGDADLCLAGWTGSIRMAEIYRNDGSSFTDLNTGLAGMRRGSVDWSDFDNDGDLDLLIMGEMKSLFVTPTTIVYRNDGGSFVVANTWLPGLTYGDAVWADFDGDLDPDFVQCGVAFGSGRAFLQVNNEIVANTAPQAPPNLNSTVTPTGATLNWDPAVDGETPQGGLSYALRVGTSPGAEDVISASALSTGQRMVAGSGSCRAALSRTIDGLTPGAVYYWSVQTVDGSGIGSAFAPEESFTVGAPTAVDDPSSSPTRFALRGGFPNPGRAFDIRFDLPRPSKVDLAIYTTRGRLVRRLHKQLPQGRHALSWDGRDDQGQRVVAGVYVLRLTAGEQRSTGRVVLLR